MNHILRSRSIVVSILTVTLITIAGLFLFSNHLPSASSSGPAINRRERVRSPFFRKIFGPAMPDDYDDGEHVLAVPYYNLTGGWESTVMLSNQAPTQAEVGITLFSLDGQQLNIPPVSLGPRTANVFDLKQWAVGDPFLKGSLQIRYDGQERQVAGVVKVIHAKRSLIYDEQLTEPQDYFKSSRLEGAWWLPSEKAEMFVVASNTSDAALSTEITIYGSKQKQLGSNRFSLAAHETRIINAKELTEKGSKNVPEIGGVTITHTGAPGTVFAVALIQDPSAGFSSIAEFRDPQASVSSRLDGAGLRIGAVANEELNQIAVARNVGDQLSTLSGRIVYTTRDGDSGAIPISKVDLGPGETAAIDLVKPIKKARLRDVSAAGLEFEYASSPGSVVMSALSVSASANQVFRVPLIDVKSQPNNTGQYPLTINQNSSTVVYLKNTTSESQKYVLEVTYPGGAYVQGLKELEAGRTLTFDFQKLRDEQTPDANGNKIPLSVTDGYMSWSAHSTKHTIPGQMQSPDEQVMLGRSESADISKGISSTATYGCNCPDSFAESWIEHRLPNGHWAKPWEGQWYLYMGENVQVRAVEQDHDCFWNYLQPYIISGSPGSQNDPVATFAPNYNGELTGVSPGTADIQAYWSVAYWYPLYDCCWYQSEDTAPYDTVTVIGATISGPDSTKDGSFYTPSFTLTPQNGTPSSYQWSWTAPIGAGNNPLVTFTPPDQATTSTNRHWFALPNVACPYPPYVSNPPQESDPYYNSVYTIRGQANFPGGHSVHQDTTLTINNYWNPGGTTAPPVVSGSVSIGLNSNTNLWEVTGPGTLVRHAPVVTIYVPVDSQFYDKTVLHENRHVWQYESGPNSDLFTVADLMAQLSPLTDPTQAGLNAKIQQAVADWRDGQLIWVAIRRDAMEQDAHSVSDPWPPQYAYQQCQ